MLPPLVKRIFKKVHEVLDERCYEQWGYLKVSQIESRAKEILGIISLKEDVSEENLDEFLTELKNLRGRNFKFEFFGVSFGEKTEYFVRKT